MDSFDISYTPQISREGEHEKNPKFVSLNRNPNFLLTNYKLRNSDGGRPLCASNKMNGPVGKFLWQF